MPSQHSAVSFPVGTSFVRALAGGVGGVGGVGGAGGVGSASGGAGGAGGASGAVMGDRMGDRKGLNLME